MSVIFSNPGVIDPRGITTLGVNVKENDGAIGFFGTGLKYAICVILRLGGNITIHAGPQVHAFTLKPFTMRGKEFFAIAMNGVELGFTTEFGKSWEPWMAYRELYSNAKDEGGVVFTGDDIPDDDGSTQIVVDCSEIDAAHLMRETFLISEDRRPRFTVPEVVEVYDGSSEYIFYRGIRAGAVPAGKRSAFTYNILQKCDLTEDRTLDSSYYAYRSVELALLKSEDAAYIAACVTEKNDDVLEAKVDFNWTSYDAPNSTFMAVVNQIKQERTGDLNEHSIRKLVKHTPRSMSPDGRPFTPSERALLDAALAFVRSIGYPCDNTTIKCAESLGENVLAMAIQGQIVLSADCFRQGLRLVVHALIEEHLHIKTGCSDMTRNFQTALFHEIIRLGEELSGQSLEPQAKAA